MNETQKTINKWAEKTFRYSTEDCVDHKMRINQARK